MLSRLIIKNYAIIEELEIKFGGQMNIITGETGAGKSILLGALSLILGERADTKALYDKEEKCVVEAEFEISAHRFLEFFAAHELDFETHTIIRREINERGKSRAFVNDTPVNLALLKELGEKLVNLHSQHETLNLVNSGFQLAAIDALAGNKDLLLSYREQYNQYHKKRSRLDEMIAKWKAAAAELDYLQFQLKELAEANLQPGEQEAREAEQKTLSNVEEIRAALHSAVRLISDGEMPVAGQLSEIQLLLKGVKNYNDDIALLTGRLQSVYEEIKDISSELENIGERTLADPEKLEEVNNRLSTIYKLQKKHQVNSVGELLRIQHALEDKIAAVDTGSSEIEQLKAQVEKQFKDLLSIAGQMHSAREKVLRNFQTNVTVLLARLGMPNASFKVDMRKLEPGQLNATGLSEVRFLFSANKGFAPLEIKDVASGGELSRLMLSIKSLVAGADALPTLIFDEIDAGISGEAALKAGEIMKTLSRNHQIICITHLPQIARTGDTHLYVYKETKGPRTQTLVRELKQEEKVQEIAKMLSGNKPSEASLANAREMMAL